MAPKPPKGSRDKESKQIAEELVGLLKDQLDLEEDIKEDIEESIESQIKDAEENAEKEEDLKEIKNWLEEEKEILIDFHNKFFEKVLKFSENFTTPMDILYFGLSILSICIGYFLINRK